MKTKIWIARDKTGELFIYNNKPILGKLGTSYYASPHELWNYMEIDKDSHPEITFENSPQQIEI